MFARATITEATKCTTVGEIIALLQKHPADTPVCCGMVYGVTVEKHTSRRPHEGYAIAFEEADEDDEEEDDEDQDDE